MNVNQMRTLAKENDPTAIWIKKAIKKINKRILKAARNGEYQVDIRLKYSFLYPLMRFLHHTPGARFAVVQYFREIGFSVEDCGSRIVITWFPDNYWTELTICAEDNKLKHLVQTGNTPKVLIEDEDE